MKQTALLSLAALAFALAVAPAASQTAAPTAAPAAPSPGEIVAKAQPGEWVQIAASDLLVMTLAPDAKGKARKVVIQLIPAPFSQGHVGNIRKLAAAHWWDGTSVNRVQDNYVAQWGDATEKKALPAGLATVAESDYRYRVHFGGGYSPGISHQGREIPGTYYTTISPTMEWATDRDAYAAHAGYLRGWPVAGERPGNEMWPVHCYGMVGVGRNLSPDTGTGAELYTVIGHAPRHLDRNIALVGRVIAGIEHLSSLPRGTGALGFYETEGERVPIVSVRLASELPEAERPRFDYLRTEGETFARYADARANRRDPFFNVPAGGADICNIPVPIRPRP